MKIVNISGGLGNQMFQYAFALLLKHLYPDEEIRIDTQHYWMNTTKHIGGTNFFHNGFEIYKVFRNATIKQASLWSILRLTYFIPNYTLDIKIRKHISPRRTEFQQKASMTHRFDYEALALRGNCCYRGIFGSIIFYKEIKPLILSHFQFDEPVGINKTIHEQILGCNAVALHVRRGDYLNLHRFQNVCTMTYYNNSIKYILDNVENPVFFIFSNDIEWCKENISTLIGNHPNNCIDHNLGNNSFWDMFLMSQCKYQIIANSTFSWWSAFLNSRAEKVLVPEIWKSDGTMVDLYDEDWIKINIENHLL